MARKSQVFPIVAGDKLILWALALAIFSRNDPGILLATGDLLKKMLLRVNEW